MEYENFNPEIHDTKKVASLIYDVDFRTFDRLFKSKEDAVKAIEKDLIKEDCLKVILDGDIQIGILMAYTKDTPQKFRFKDLRLLAVDFLDYFVLSDINEGDLYIAEIAIDRDLRSKGYGKRVICDVIDYGRRNNYNRVILDADFRNLKAKKLYESLGFKVFNRKSFLKRGMYNMEFNIS